ncbi:anti-sigma factor family protein [Paraburkholderia flava]|uniref:anti-sigma factor family protein n=1 Tax=Paraburkholderia flava TaxID=2547393 RepID=UPI00106086D2|nr:anti-sigma factor [Paraburkholderia flava]
MKPDDIELLAYVNGELPEHAREEVERAVQTSPDVAEQVALLRASRLPYREAFAQQKLPPVPSRLAAQIEALAREAAQKNSSAAQPGVNDPVIPTEPGIANTAPIRSRLRVAPAWLAVAFVAGAFMCGAVLRFAPGAASGLGGFSTASADTRPWITAAAGYQQLYSRETLENVDANAELSEKTLEQIRDQDGLALSIPDLRDAGLTFKRVQRLRFGDKALVQIVYLPQQGAPVALCVMKEAKPDAAVATARVASMNVVTWRQAELGYVLIGQPGDSEHIDLDALAKRISGNHVDSLFSDVTTLTSAIHAG